MRQPIRFSIRLVAVLAAGLVAGTVAPAAAQDISARNLDIEVGGRLQAQIVHSSVGGPAAQGILRRARITLDATLNEWIDGRLQLDQGGELKDAYARISFNPSFQLSVGKFKRAFDPFELDSSADIVLERDGRIPGLSTCAGVGSICSWSRMSEALGYSDRDVGVRVGGALGDQWTYQATITNGTGVDSDTNDAKTVAGRLTVDVVDDVTLGGNLSIRDYTPFPGAEMEFANAWGVDLEIGDFETPGFHVQTGFMGGDNWELDFGGDVPTFVSAQGILSWYRPVEDAGPVVGVEPLARISWTDPDTDSPDDAGVLITPGLWAHFGDRNKIGATVDVYSQDPIDTEFSLKVFTHLYF
ncbi:MAG: porin [Longimicrobiales bacterium]|nr:porin [Longimicrobiales bacterium]